MKFLKIMLQAVACIAFSAFGLAALLLKPNGFTPVLGTSYPVINATTVSDLTNLTDKAREELWSRFIVAGAEKLYQDNPLADNFTSRTVGGRPNAAQLKKAVVMLTDFSKVAGNTINIPTRAGLGGPGVAGEGNRIGAEQKRVIGNFQCKIGRYWFGVGYTAVARDETVIGGRLDAEISEDLRTLMAKKRNDDHMMRLIQAAASANGANNNLFPDGVGDRAELLSADVIDTTLITKGGEILPGMGALPMDTTSDSGGSLGELYTLLSTDKGLIDLQSEPAYLQVLREAGVRGDANKCFTGGFTNWLGHGIYRWINRDHGNRGPVGSPLLPRAFLGAVVNSGTTTSSGNSLSVASGTVIHGGGNVWVSGDTTTNYFEFFDNAPYQFFNGDLIAADTSTTRHIMIINRNGTFGVFPYTNNTGNTITISGSALAVGPSAKRTTTFHKGAKIVQCNILGTVVGRSLYLGAQALVAGAGTINGSTVDPKMGKRTEEHRNHDMDHAIGIESVWGNAVVQRAGDGAYPNFLLVHHAISEPGAPTITA